MRRLRPRVLALTGAVALALSLPTASTAADIDLEVAAAMSETVVSALEAGQQSQGLAAARRLRDYLHGEEDGDAGEGLAILQRMQRITKLYELSADSPDASVIAEVEQAHRTFRNGVPGQKLRYPNGQTATYRFGGAHEWKFPGGGRIAYRATEDQEWKYPNGQRMAYRPTASQEWKYPNGQRLAYRPTSSQEWKYANGARIAFRPTSSQEWKYPNGRRICYRLGAPRQAWYYPDGTRWHDQGPTYTDAELADVPRVITRILEDAGWGDRPQAAGAATFAAAALDMPRAPGAARQAAPLTSEVAATLRRLEADLPDQLRFAHDRPLGRGTVGDFLEAQPIEDLNTFVYEEAEGFRAEIQGARQTVEVLLDASEGLRWESAEVRARR